MRVLPAILSTTKKDLVQKLKLVRKYPLIQIDIGDGEFVKNKTIQPLDFRGITDLPPIEFHLMVTDIDHYLEHCARLNAATIVFHTEACKNDDEILHLIRHIKSHDINVGLAINPKTPIARIKKFLKKIDQVLIMTVHPGFGGQKFIKKMLVKIKALRMFDKKIVIEVDGGVDETTAVLAAKAGANTFVVGSAFFGVKDPDAAFQKIQKTIKKA